MKGNQIVFDLFSFHYSTWHQVNNFAFDAAHDSNGLNIVDWSENEMCAVVRMYIFRTVFGCSSKIGWVKSNELESKYHVYCSFNSSLSLSFVYPNAVCSRWFFFFFFVVNACCLSCKEWAEEKINSTQIHSYMIILYTYLYVVIIIIMKLKKKKKKKTWS